MEKIGYITNFCGSIELKNKKAIAIINKLIEKEDYPFDYEITKIKKGVLNLNCSWKNYEKEMEKLCLFVVKLDKNAEGEIECFGEEQEDIWKINVNNGRVFIQIAKIVFDEEEEFNTNDNEFNKALYKVTKDEKLRNEIIANEL